MTGRLTVALVSDAVYPHHKGGKEIRYHEVARWLAEQGHHVDVYTMRWWGHEEAPRTAGVAFHALCPLVPMYAHGRRSVVQALVFAASCLRLLTRSFDVVDADHMPYLQLFTLRLVTWLRRRPLVVTWHEVWGAEYWVAYLGPRGRLAAGVEALAMRLPDHILAASEETARRLRTATHGRVPVTVLPNAVDRTAIEATAPGESGPDLLFVGRLLEHKGVHVLLAALAELRGKGLQPSCQVLGSGPEKGRLVALTAALGLQEQVTFTSDVGPHEEVFALMKASRVFVLPSVREGFGIAVAEALACGLPVVTTNAADNLSRLLITGPEDGYLCDPEPQALARALEQALAGSPDRATGRARSRGTDRSWQAVGLGTVEVYDACLAM